MEEIEIEMSDCGFCRASVHYYHFLLIDQKQYLFIDQIIYCHEYVISPLCTFYIAPPLNPKQLSMPLIAIKVYWHQVLFGNSTINIA